MNNLVKQITLACDGTQEQIIRRIERYCKINNYSYTNLSIDENSCATFTTYSNISYNDLVNQLVKERYSDSEEYAILRKALKEKTDEFYIYDAYVEECKVKAKEFIAKRDALEVK